jgi:hypothetical protein
VEAVLRLQRRGFSLESLVVLFDALASGQSLAAVLGVAAPAAAAERDGSADSADLYGFAELQPRRVASPGRPLLSVVPTTVWDENRAS